MISDNKAKKINIIKENPAFREVKVKQEAKVAVVKNPEIGKDHLRTIRIKEESIKNITITIIVNTITKIIIINNNNNTPPNKGNINNNSNNLNIIQTTTAITTTITLIGRTIDIKTKAVTQAHNNPEKGIPILDRVQKVILGHVQTLNNKISTPNSDSKTINIIITVTIKIHSPQIITITTIIMPINSNKTITRITTTINKIIKISSNPIKITIAEN